MQSGKFLIGNSRLGCPLIINFLTVYDVSMNIVSVALHYLDAQASHGNLMLVFF
jgi:hypothetical protein